MPVLPRSYPAMIAEVRSIERREEEREIAHGAKWHAVTAAVALAILAGAVWFGGQALEAETTAALWYGLAAAATPTAFRSLYLLAKIATRRCRAHRPY